MKNLVNTYVDQFRQDRQKQLKLAAVLAALALIVAGVVFWQLHSTGVAMTNEVFCGQEEHVHDENCYEEVLICDIEEADHVHDDSCYETVLTCQIPEHTHTIECMTDDTADVETANMWEATLPALSGNWSQDVAAIAESQLGYTESTANFVLADDGETHMGYTRYGAWYGNEYGDWDAMFASFCLNYAGVPSSVVAENSGAYALAVSLNEQGLYIDSADFTPAAGDLVFFDENGNGQADRVGIIVNVGGDELAVIEGNSEDAVAENTYNINDSGILAFGILPDQGTTDGTENIDGDIVYAANDGGVYVSVTAPADALPEGAELSVTLIDEDSTDYTEAADAIGMNIQPLASDEEETGMVALDICFLMDGVEVEPAEAVTVSIDASAVVPEGAGNIVIRHLEETTAGTTPVVVAELNSAEPVAEFEVESFSVFTITWDDGTGATIEVHVYNINGTSIDEELDVTSYTSTNSTITISDLVSHLESHESYANEYTYVYATVYYEVAQTQGASYDPYTIGDADNSVTRLQKNGTTYTVSYGTNSTETVSDPYLIQIRLYYSVPVVEITATGEHTSTVALSAEGSYFQHLESDYSNASYSWTLSDDAAGTITAGENGTATFVWSDDAAAGDHVTITVRMTVTYMEDGEEKTETASDTYTLTYGEQAVTVTVYAEDGRTLQANAHVALVDSDGNTVATGVTGSDGTVVLYAPAGTYTVGVTYAYQSSTMGGGETTRYTTEGTVTVTEGTNSTSVTLENGVTSGPGGNTSGSNAGGNGPYYYEHIDVKVAVIETEDSDVVFSDLDAVYVYDKYGNLIYYTEDLVANAGTTDYNCLFDINGDEDTHSIVVSSEDTIVIVYEVIDNSTGETKTYTATYTSAGTYPDDEYYPYDSINAYQLYNCIYGTTISEDDWETALANGTLRNLLGDNYNGYGIDISGMTYIQVADYLCDTRTITGQAGLDFVIDIADVVYEEYDIEIAKTFVEVPPDFEETDLGEFEFTLQELDTVEDGNGETEYVWSAESENVLGTVSGVTETWTKNADGTWTSVITLENFLEYEAEEGTNYYYYILSESGSDTSVADQQYYGIKITTTYSSLTGITEVVASYCDLELSDENTYTRSSGWYSLTEREGTYDNGETYAYFEIPFVNTYDVETYHVDIFKYTGDEGDEQGLAGAVFVIENDEGLYACFVEEDGVYNFAGWYDPDSEDPPEGTVSSLTSGEYGYIHIEGMSAGNYLLVETAAPEGYNPLSGAIGFAIDAEGDVTGSTIMLDGSVGVENTESRALPNTGGAGTWIFTATGLLLIGGAASLLVYRKRRAV